MSTPQDARGRLVAARSAGIARSLGLEPAGDATPLRGGAALAVAGGGAVVVVQEDPERGLGAALAWALRSAPPGPLSVVIDVDRSGKPQPAAAAVVAAKAAGLARPPAVRWVEGGTTVEAAPAPPPPPGPYVPSPAAAARLADAAAARAEVVPHADGSLSLEVRGLEVGRVAVDGSLSVGAGRHDREATAELFDHAPTREALVRAAEVVRQLRRAGEQPGPPTLLQRERWLRLAIAEADPGVVALPEPVPPVDLRRPRPAGAVADGGATLVVCSAGVDLDLVPAAALLRATFAPGAERIRLLVPPADRLPITVDLAALLPVPAEVVAVAPPWEV